MSLTLTPGRNCWRVAQADRFALIVDGADYFRALRHTLKGARQLAVMIGWDFDFELEMFPGESDAEGNAPDGLPNAVGPFLEALVGRRPELDIYLLKWSGGALIAPGRALPALRTKLWSPGQIHLAFDGRHPIGACHHQKIVVVDDAVAFCGGIDLTEGRWDTPDHTPGDPRRRLRSGAIGRPWHDASAVMIGPAARTLGELARARWERANDAPLPEPVPEADADALWPAGVDPDFRDVPVAVARTQPPERDAPVIAEIERLYLDAIAAARRSIYIESQYFSAGSIARAIASRLAEPDGPEIMIINPDAAEGLVEDMAMHVTRSRIMLALQRADRFDRFRMLTPLNSAGEAVYVHAKLLIVDDVLLRVGSSNIDRRSMGFDTEADVAVQASTPRDRARITAIRDRLLAEHLGVTPRLVAEAAGDGMIAAIDRLNPRGPRRLVPLTPRNPGPLGNFLSHTRLFDPRFRQSAKNRLGLTGRHVLWAAVAGAGLAIWRARRSRR